MDRMITTTVKIPIKYITMIDELVKLGRYTTRSEFIRKAIENELERQENIKIQTKTIKLVIDYEDQLL